MLHRDEKPAEPVRPCCICSAPSTHEFCERYPLCLACIADAFREPRFCKDYATSCGLAGAWVKERRAALAAEQAAVAP